MCANMSACGCDHTKWEFGEFEWSEVNITARYKRFYHESHHSFERRNLKDRKTFKLTHRLLHVIDISLKQQEEKATKLYNRIKLCDQKNEKHIPRGNFKFASEKIPEKVDTELK